MVEPEAMEIRSSSNARFKRLLALASSARDRKQMALALLEGEHLAQAYADFVASSPIAERIFKVHQDALRPKPEPNRPFVPLSALKGE